MIKQALSYILRGLPLSFIEWLSQWQSNRIVARILRLSLRNRTVILRQGVGNGLKFNAGSSNPEYALGTNEWSVQEAFARYLKPGDTFYDIGANVGFFTMIGAKLVGSNGQVYAFEPVPENAAVIRQNAQCNKFQHVNVIEKAVSDSTGTGELLLAHYSGGAALSTAGQPPDFKGAIAVDLISIDDLVEQQQIAPPTFVKIDVEGAEIQVLQGMMKTIKEFHPMILCEVDDKKKNAFQHKHEAVEAIMRSLGYEIAVLESSYPTMSWHVGHIVGVPLVTSVGTK